MDKRTFYRILHKKSGYDWIHPSWRDLVIEYLGTNKRARHEFLARCEWRGVLLALSTGGGSEGERSFPLARSRGDWKQIGDAVCRILESADQETAARILTGLAHAFATESQVVEKYRPSSDEILRISQNGLDRCRETWDSREDLLDTKTLASYYRLSTAHVPLMASPQLSLTWTVRWGLAKNELEKDEDDLNIEEDSIHSWAILAFLLSKNEPRYLRSLEFPERHSPLGALFLKRIMNYVESEPDFDGEDEIQDGIAHLDSIGKLVSLLGEAMPSLKRSVAPVTRELNLLDVRLQEDLAERYPEEEAEYDRDEDYFLEPKDIDVDQLFADL